MNGVPTAVDVTTPSRPVVRIDDPEGAHGELGIRAVPAIAEAFAIGRPARAEAEGAIACEQHVGAAAGRPQPQLGRTLLAQHGVEEPTSVRREIGKHRLAVIGSDPFGLIESERRRGLVEGHDQESRALSLQGPCQTRPAWCDRPLRPLADPFGNGFRGTAQGARPGIDREPEERRLVVLTAGHEHRRAVARELERGRVDAAHPHQQPGQLRRRRRRLSSVLGQQPKGGAELGVGADDGDAGVLGPHRPNRADERRRQRSEDCRRRSAVAPDDVQRRRGLPVRRVEQPGPVGRPPRSVTVGRHAMCGTRPALHVETAAVPLRTEGDALAGRRPVRLRVIRQVGGERCVRAGRDIADHDVDIASAIGLEGDAPAIGRPRRVPLPVHRRRRPAGLLRSWTRRQGPDQQRCSDDGCRPSSPQDAANADRARKYFQLTPPDEPHASVGSRRSGGEPF